MSEQVMHLTERDAERVRSALRAAQEVIEPIESLLGGTQLYGLSHRLQDALEILAGPQQSVVSGAALESRP